MNIQEIPVFHLNAIRYYLEREAQRLRDTAWTTCIKHTVMADNYCSLAVSYEKLIEELEKEVINRK